MVSLTTSLSVRIPSCGLISAHSFTIDVLSWHRGSRVWREIWRKWNVWQSGRPLPTTLPVDHKSPHTFPTAISPFDCSGYSELSFLSPPTTANVLYIHVSGQIQSCFVFSLSPLTCLPMILLPKQCVLHTSPSATARSESPTWRRDLRPIAFAAAQPYQSLTSCESTDLTLPYPTFVDFFSVMDIARCSYCILLSSLLGSG